MKKNHIKSTLLLVMLILVTLSTPDRVTAIQLPVTDSQVYESIKMQPKRVAKLPSRGVTTSAHEDINSYIEDICKDYNMDPKLVKSIVYHESRYRPTAKNGNCVGLMQVSTRWHSKRAEKLGVKNLYDPYGNILVGVDYLSELFSHYEDPALVLMLYNMKHDTAISMYKHGQISNYAKSVLAKAETF